MKEFFYNEEEKLGIRTAEHSLLYRIASSLQKCSSYREVMELVIEEMSNHFDCEVSFVGMVDGNELKIMASRGLSEETREKLRIKKGNILFLPYLTGEKIKMANLSDISSPLEQLREYNIKSFYCEPMYIGDKRTGVIFIGRQRNESFTLEDERVMKTVVNLVRVTLQNISLQINLKQWSETLEEKVKERTKELQEAYEKLKSLDKLKSKFVQDTAHELKTPLSVILTALKMLDKAKGEDRRKLIGFLYRNAERLRDTIEGVLEVYIMEKGREYVKEVVKIDEIIEKVIENYGVLAKEKGLKIEIKKGKIPEIMGDKRALRTVMENLVENAVKFTSKGKITVSADTENGNLVVSVSDTGVGIPKEHQKYIFERFYKISPESPGAGVGLSLCKDIIKAHGGEISFVSEYGKGSTFTFKLPIQKQEHKE